MEAIWRARPSKDSQTQHSMSLEEQRSDAEVGGAPSDQPAVEGVSTKSSPKSRLARDGISINNPPTGQLTTSDRTNEEEQDMHKSFSPRKKPRLSPTAAQENGNESKTPLSEDSDESDDSYDPSFNERVMKVREFYDAIEAEAQETESKPPAGTNEVLAVLNRALHDQTIASRSLDVPQPAGDPTAPLPGNYQAPAATIPHSQRSPGETAAGNANSEQVGTGVPRSPPAEPGLDQTQVSLGSDAFLSSSSSPMWQNLVTRETRINTRKRAFRAASGDGDMGWASSGPGLQCVRDHHTEPEVELG